MELSYEPLMIYLITYSGIRVLSKLAKVDTKTRLSFMQVSRNQELWKEKVRKINVYYKLPSVSINWMYMYWALKKRDIPTLMGELADNRQFNYLLVCYSRAERIYGMGASGRKLKEAQYYFEKICRYGNLELVLQMRGYEPCLVTHQTLISAAKNGNLELLQYLMTKYRGDLHFSNSAIIRVAAVNNSVNVVKYLLENYPHLDPTIAHKKFRYSCVFKVFNRGLRDMMVILLTDHRVRNFIKTSYIKEVAIKRGQMIDLLCGV
jgi:hypothetical protein